MNLFNRVSTVADRHPGAFSGTLVVPITIYGAMVTLPSTCHGEPPCGYSTGVDITIVPDGDVMGALGAAPLDVFREKKIGVITVKTPLNTL